MGDGNKAYLVGYAHIDPVWMWRLPEGLSEIKATFQSALDRMEEYEDFRFVSSAASYYEWVERNCPDMFREIQRRVAEGRWILAGGMWVEPDCNIPCGESLARHGLYAQRYFQERFGRMARAGLNADTFGHNGMLPQILAKSGLTSYLFMRPMAHEKSLEANLFVWEGVDGTRIPAFRLTHYATFAGMGEWDTRASLENDLRMAREQGTDFVFFYGVGNHGGGPTRENLDLLTRWVREDEERGRCTAVFASPEDYFDDIGDIGALPVVRGDLKYHAVGCYSALSLLKRNNRRAERRLLSAETFGVLAHRLLAHPPHTEALRDAWKALLFDQFHDLMGGCHIRSAYEDCLESMGYALHIAANAQSDAVQRLSWAIDTSCGRYAHPDRGRAGTAYWEEGPSGTPLVAFNPLAWEATLPIEIGQHFARIADESGTIVPCQRIRAEQTNGADDHWGSLFHATIPSWGYRVYWLHREDGTAPEPAMIATPNLLENDHVRLRLDDTGAILSLYDKNRQMELLAPGETGYPYVFDETHCDTWAHGIERFEGEMGRFDEDVRMEVVENGPLRAAIRVEARYGRSTLRQEFRLYRDRPDVEMRVSVHWRERHAMLRMKLPTALTSPRLLSDIPYGHMAYPTDGTEQVGGMWVTLCGAIGGEGAGVAVCNDATYAFAAQGGCLHTTLLRSPGFADHYGSRDDAMEYTDQGERDFRFRLLPLGADVDVPAIARWALELNADPPTVMETLHGGPLPMIYEGIRVEDPRVIAHVLKPAEDGEGWMLRCQETSGAACETRIVSAPLGCDFRAAFAPLEIKTYRLTGEAEPSEEVLLTEYA